MKHRKKLFILATVLLFLPFLSLTWPQLALAKPAIVITPLEADINTNVNYCFGWQSENLDAAQDNLAVAFADDFDLSNLTISNTVANTEVYFYIGSTDCSSGGRPGAAGFLVDRDNMAVWGNTIVINLEDALGPIADSTNLSVGLVLKAGTTVVTPLIKDNYLVKIYQYYDNSGTIELDWFDAQLLYIGGANHVEINATVDPTLSLNVVETGSDNAQTACSMSTFNPADLNTCAYRLKVSTNATGGYTAYIKENDQFKNAAGDLFAYIGIDNTLNAGTAEYGAATTTSSLDISQLDDADSSGTRNADDCTYIGTPSNDVNSSNFSALSANDQSIAANTSQVSNEYTTVCHGASIAGSTPAGIYANIVYLTIVANF